MTKGFLAENFVAQELLAGGRRELYSWTERNSEIEFLIYQNDAIAPVEVKAGHRTQAKSLRQYLTKYSPSIVYKLSANNLSRTDAMVNLPLYFAGKL